MKRLFTDYDESRFNSGFFMGASGGIRTLDLLFKKHRRSVPLRSVAFSQSQIVANSQGYAQLAVPFYSISFISSAGGFAGGPSVADLASPVSRDMSDNRFRRPV